MPVIKQKTVGDDTLLLKRAKTQKPGKQYEYFVTERGGGPIDDPVYTREEAMAQFRETVSAYENVNESNGRGGPPGLGGGFMGGGGGFFGGGRDEDTDDEDEQRGPVGVGMGFFDADGDGEDDEPPEFRFL